MSQVIRVQSPSNRYDLGYLLRARGYRKAVEVGTDLGTFACHLLSKWDGELICCDDFRPYEWNKWPRDADMIIAATRLAQFNGRGRIVQCESLDLADNLPKWFTEQLDFVYIDACHDYESVTQDLNAWWPRITDNGMLAGHDFDQERHPEVYTAVIDFAHALDRDIFVIEGDGYCYSWWLGKSEDFSR